VDKIRIIKGRDKEFYIYIVDEKERPVDLAGYSQVKALIHRKCGTPLTKFSPMTLGVNAIQTLTFPSAPDAGTYKLQYQETGEKTSALAHNDNAAAIQSALNALNGLSGVVVTGSGPFSIEFAGVDGKRAQELLKVTDSSLTLLSVAVVPVVATSQEGVPISGAEVVSEECGQIRLKLSEEDVNSLDTGLDQDLDIRIRKSDSDMDIEPMYRLLDVLAAPGNK